MVTILLMAAWPLDERRNIFVGHGLVVVATLLRAEWSRCQSDLSASSSTLPLLTEEQRCCDTLCTSPRLSVTPTLLQTILTVTAKLEICALNIKWLPAVNSETLVYPNKPWQELRSTLLHEVSHPWTLIQIILRTCDFCNWIKSHVMKLEQNLITQFPEAKFYLKLFCKWNVVSHKKYEYDILSSRVIFLK